MSEQQISKLAGSLVEHQRYFSEMPTEDRQWTIQHTKDAIALFVEVVKNRERATALPASDTFRLTVDYGLSLEQMIAAGRYDWKNDEITAKRFPIVGKGIVEFEARYFHFNRNISSEEAERLFCSEPIVLDPTITFNFWEPAKIEHVLSHGATFPKKQLKFPIIGLGSVAWVDDRRNMPGLYKDGSKRNLYLYLFDSVRSPVCRFLAVRKVSAS